MSERFTYSHGGVIRGPKDKKRLSLVFTGGDFGEGFETVLDTLSRRSVPGSFYFTGDFLRNTGNQPLVRRAVSEGHIVGPHSDEHLLYCPWEDRQKTLVTRDEFLRDLEANDQLLRGFDVSEDSLHWWIPPYEWYNEEIVNWSIEAGHRLFCFTPGTLSHTDYTEDDAPNYRSNQTIWDSILDFEKREQAGLNGFLLLTHVGAGERRTQKFFDRLSDLIGYLDSLGYGFATVPELLTGT